MFLPVGRSAAGFGSQYGKSWVRHSFVFEGLIIARGPWFAIGISARATFELKGPTIARTLGSESICWTFCAPFCGSCTPFTVSSNGLKVSVMPL